MKIVMTLLVRDEVDVVDAQLAYHLGAGVDFVVATDHASTDGTIEILESYARAGVLHLIREQGPVRESGWRTRMARLAATDFDANWVINTDADEFWLPREGTLVDALSEVPAEFGMVWGLTRPFVLRPDDGRPFFERMVVYAAPAAAINDPASPYRPSAKAAHRGDADIVVMHGAHSAHTTLRLMREWYPIDVGHFPYRTIEQYERKNARRAHGVHSLGQYVKGFEAQQAGRLQEAFDSLVVDQATVELGIALGYLGVDTRLRDALRAHTSSEDRRRVEDEKPSWIDGQELLEANVVRLSRSLDDLGARVTGLEFPDGRRFSTRTGHGLAAALAAIIVLLVALPEMLGDKPYDPKPSAWPASVSGLVKRGERRLGDPAETLATMSAV